MDTLCHPFDLLHVRKIRFDEKNDSLPSNREIIKLITKHQQNE